MVLFLSHKTINNGSIMKNSNASKIKVINGTFCIELPKKIITHMWLTSADVIEFGYSKDVKIWKRENIDISSDIYRKLKGIFKTENNVFQWLNRKQNYLIGKAPISLLNEDKGKEKVLGLIERLERGDFS